MLYQKSGLNTKIPQKGMRIMLNLLTAMLTCVVLLTGYLLLLSPGVTEPYRDSNGNVLPESISEKTFATIGGVKQGMMIKGKNANNPVALFLHGGPGMPTYFLTKQFPNGLEDYFTVCYWEQRGAGISYTANMNAADITTEQLVSDAIEVTNYLCRRFGQEKIYLIGHSWGSFIGLLTAAQAPELYHAYIGISQITNQAESEKIAYAWMTARYTEAGNSQKMKLFSKYPIDQSVAVLAAWFKTPERDSCMHELGVGTMRDMKDVYSGVFFPYLGMKEYTLAEKFNTFFRAKPFLRNKTKLIDQLFSFDLSARVPELAVPVYFMSGSYDLTVNHDLNKAYFTELMAPVKGYYTFGASAHSPQHEEPERFMQIMREDVLNGKTDLADSAF